MNSKGIKNAYALLGGTQVWVNAGYPMEGEPKKEAPKGNSNSNKPK